MLLSIQLNLTKQLRVLNISFLIQKTSYYIV